jgi:hypothetical protein
MVKDSSKYLGNLKTTNKSFLRYRKKPSKNDLLESSFVKIPSVLKTPKTLLDIHPYTFNIKVVNNNIFCTLSRSSKGSIIVKCTSGKYKIKLSKKTIKFHINKIIYLFLKERKIKDITKNKDNFFFNILASSRLKIKIVKQVLTFWSKRGVIIRIKPTKCFNGCKVSKIRRKKRKGFCAYK